MGKWEQRQEHSFCRGNPLRLKVPSYGNDDSITTHQPRMAKSELAQKTLARIRQRLATASAPSVQKVIRLIQELTQNSSTISVEHLAETVSTEPRVLEKILAVANTLGYNPEGVPIETLPLAIQVIGFEKVRNLAISLMLVENAESSLNPEETRESAAITLASALLAREIIRREKICDPELGFACAVLRNYGRLLMAHFLSDDYREARALAASMQADEAYEEVFGLTPVELSYHLLKAEQLPESLGDAMKQLPAYLVTTAAFAHEESVFTLTDLSAKLCEIVDHADLTHATFAPRAQAVLEEFGVTLSLNGRDIETLMKSVSQMMQGKKGIDPHPSPVQERIRALAEGKPLPPPLIPKPKAKKLAESKTAFASKNAAPTAAPPVEKPKSAEEQLAEGLTQLAALFDKRSVDTRSVYEVATKALITSLHLIHCLVLVEDPDSPRFYVRYGIGEFFEKQRNRCLIERTGKDVFALVMARGEDVLIEKPSDPKIHPFLPSWLAQTAQDHPIVLLPIRDASRRVFAIICGVSKDQTAFHGVGRCNRETVEIRQYLSRCPRLDY